MLTEDIRLPEDGSWLAIEPLTDQVIIHNDTGRECLVRFGAASTSTGMPLVPDETLMVDETVYIRSKKFPAEGSLRVTR